MQAQDSSDPTGVAVVGGKKSKEVERARDRKANAALTMAIDGYDWRAIARSLGYPTERAALVAVESALESRLMALDKDHLRALMNGRLERIYRLADKKASDHSSPEQLAAIGKVREIIADQRKLWGLDAPAEIIVTNPTQAEIDQWVARMTATQVPPVEEADIVDAEWTEEAG